MNVREMALKLHKDHEGKLALDLKVPLKSPADLTLAYTPGVAEPCIEINKNPETIYDYTSKGNWVAIVTNGTAVLGLGDIGAGAGLPVMEGKAVLFKAFGGVDAFPICLDTKDPDEIVRTVKLMEPGLGGVNLEDIGAPACFEIERKLKEICDIPIFHDDQHGTAVIVLAGLINALKVVGKQSKDCKIVINGAGAAGIAIAKLVLGLGVADLIICNSKGIVYRGREGLNPSLVEIAEMTNKENLKGTLADAMKGADVFIGVSAPNTVTREMVATMAKDAIVFAMANPVPEIFPDEAKAGGARVVGTGRSDFPNQVNNVSAFPGIFRGALDVRASDINEPMKLAAARAIAGALEDSELGEENILPGVFDPRVAPLVAKMVAQAAIDSGVARRTDVTADWVYEHAKKVALIDK